MPKKLKMKMKNENENNETGLRCADAQNVAAIAGIAGIADIFKSGFH